MTQDPNGPNTGERASGCRVDIHIKNTGDVHVHACCTDKKDGTKSPSPSDEVPPRTEGACIPLGLGCKPKQSRTHKLERLRARCACRAAE